VDFILKHDDVDLENKFKKSIDENGFCIVKNFVDSKIVSKKMALLRQNFDSKNDLRRTGKYFYKMPNFQRIDLGDYAQINARFSRMFSQFLWNEDSLFFDEISHLIKFRNTYCNLSQENFIYKIGDEQFCDLPKLLHYPIGGGFMNMHKDGNNEYAVMNFLLALTKRGIDYDSGGAYYIDHNDEYLDAEEILDVGDLYSHNQSRLHGVKAVDSEKPIDLTSLNGRCSINLSLETFDYSKTS
jgi:hypothetical protein